MFKQFHSYFFIILTLISINGNSANFIVTSTLNNGIGSLHQAILDANATPGFDEISFNIPEEDCLASGVCQIDIFEDLPLITEALIIDGTTQPRYGSVPEFICANPIQNSHMRIQIVNSNINQVRVIKLGSTDTVPSIIKGLSIIGTENASTQPIAIKSEAQDWIYCNHIGVDATGLASNFSNNFGLCLDCGTGTNAGYGGNGIIGTNGDGVDDYSERNLIVAYNRGIEHQSGGNYIISGNYFGLKTDGNPFIQQMNTAIYVKQGASNTLIGSNHDIVGDFDERNAFAATNNAAIVINGNSTANVRINSNMFGLVGNTGIEVDIPVAIELIGNSEQRVTIKENYIKTTQTGIIIGGDTIINDDSTNNCFSGPIAIKHNGTFQMLPFINNYWGHASGPSGIGSGSGSAIEVTGTGSVEYNPWNLTSERQCFINRDYIFDDGFEG